MESEERQAIRAREIKEMRRKLFHKIVNIEAKRRSVRTIGSTLTLQGAATTSLGGSLTEYREDREL
jgi:hypothetical protein